MKRLLSLITAASLAFCLTPAAAWAEGIQSDAQIVSEGGSATAETETGGSVTVSKTVHPTELENYFDIVLSAAIEETSQDNSTAVVLVMDISNTMNESQGDVSDQGSGNAVSRLQSAQAAANKFIEQYCEGEGLSPERQIGVVTFNTDAQWAEGLGMQTVTDASAAALQGSVNAITAPSTPSSIRFTNMEAGLQLAFNELSASDAANKYVIFLTDGFPTTYVDRSIEGNEDSTESISGYDPYESGAYDAAKVGEDGYFADAVLQLPCSYGTSYSDKAAERAAQIAAEMKQRIDGAAGINIFSVGIDIGGQTIAEYVDRATGTFSIVDRTSSDYVIGDADNPEAYAEWLGSSIAGGPDMTDESPTYANGNSSEELQQAFNYILEDIRATTGMLLAKAITFDPMGDDVEFQYFYDKEGAPASELTGEYQEASSDEAAENTANYSDAEREIVWDLLQSGYTVSIGDDSTRTFMFELSYRVRLANEVEGFEFENGQATNNEAFLDYATVEPDGSTVEQDPLYYPNPEVKGYAGEFAVLKTDSLMSGLAVEGAQFELRHSDECSTCANAREEAGSLASEVSIQPVYRASAENGLVQFSSIPSGHEYLLSEAKPAEGYLPSDVVYRVRVDYGQVALMDEEGEALDASELASNGALVVENEPIEKPSDSQDPSGPGSQLGQTGDGTPLMPIALASVLLAALAGGFLLLRLVLRREDDSVV